MVLVWTVSSNSESTIIRSESLDQNLLTTNLTDHLFYFF